MPPDGHLRVRERPSRRQLIRLARLAAAGGSALLLGACGGDDEADGEDGSETVGDEGDVAVLNAALELEQTAVALYDAGAERLRGRARDAALRFREHERQHAGALRAAIRRLGGRPVEPKPAAEYARRFPALAGERDVLGFAIDLERTAVAAYIDALPKLSTPELRRTAAAILAAEAEHISVLLGALGRDQVPDAFVTGRAS